MIVPMTNDATEGGHVTTHNGSINGHDAGKVPGAVSLAVPGHGSPVPMGTVPAGHGHGHAVTVTGHGHTPNVVPVTTAPVTTAPNPKITGAHPDGHGHGARDHVTMPTVTDEPKIAAEKSAKPKKTRHRAAEIWESVTTSYYQVVLTFAIAVAASLGQVEFARKQGFVGLIKIPLRDQKTFDLTPWLAIPIFDASMAAFLHAGIQVARRGISPWPFWGIACVVAGVSVFTNASHTGGQVTAPASAVLFLYWFMKVYSQYVELEIAQKRRETAAPKILLSRLSLIDFRLARTAWSMTATRSMSLGAEHRRKEKGEDMTERELAIQCAQLYLDVLDDQIHALLRPEGGRPIRLWQRRARKIAISRARMTAADAVDHYLGRPVISREGIRPGRVSYELEPPAAVPAPKPKPRPHHDETPTSGDAPAGGGVPERKRETPKPPAGPELEPITPPSQTLLDMHAHRIEAVKRRSPNWLDDERVLSVRAIQKGLDGICPPVEGCGNSSTAREVSSLMKTLRLMELRDRK